MLWKKGLALDLVRGVDRRPGIICLASKKHCTGAAIRCAGAGGEVLAVPQHCLLWISIHAVEGDRHRVSQLRLPSNRDQTDVRRAFEQRPER